MSSTLSRIGPYEIVRSLGRGGMAEALLARLRGADGFEREVVIKRVLPELASEQQFIDMFRDEARITAQLRHGNIVQVLEFRHDDGQYYLVLEYVEGASLAAVMAHARATGGLLPHTVVAHVLVEIARALDFAHRKRDAAGTPLGVIHRDVSPSNVLVSRDGEIKLADFGIARARERIVTTSGAGIRGKLSYMAPEMLAGRPDPRSDLFALGVMGFEMLAGVHPFQAEGIEARMLRIVLHPAPPVSELVPSVPPVLGGLVARLLEKEVAARPARASEIIDALAPIASTAERPVADALADIVTQVTAAAPPEATGAKTTVDRPPRKTRPRALVVDRSPTARAVMRTALGKAVDVVEVVDAVAALDALQDAPVALVLSQQVLSGATTGVDLCAKIHADPEHGDVPFVLVVSDVAPELERKARAGGVTAVVAKSDMAGLTRVVKQIVEKLG